MAFRCAKKFLSAEMYFQLINIISKYNLKDQVRNNSQVNFKNTTIKLLNLNLNSFKIPNLKIVNFLILDFIDFSFIMVVIIDFECFTLTIEKHLLVILIIIFFFLNKFL